MYKESSFYRFRNLVVPVVEKVENRLWKNKRRSDYDDVLTFKEEMLALQSEMAADWSRNSQPEKSRATPVYWGDAINMASSAFSPAKIYLVDSSTRFGLHVLPHFKIQAFSFRGFVPDKGQHYSEKSYLSYIESHLSSDDKTEKNISNILRLPFKNGMVTDKIPNYAPRICLVYANLNEEKDRIVFMLRPRHKLNNRLYSAYCYAVMTMLVERSDGEVDFNWWEKQDTEHRNLYMKSAFVTDTMLALKKERLTMYPKNFTNIRLHSPSVMVA